MSQSKQSTADDPIFNKRINSILGEYPDHKFTPLRENQQTPSNSSKLMKMIQIILSSPCEKLHNSPFIFERTVTAASHNSSIIMNHKGDLDKLMQSLKYSFTHYGSEFRSIKLLEKLLSVHSKWPKLQSIILHDADYPLDPITEKERLEDIEFHIQ